MDLAPKIGERDSRRFLTHANRGQKSDFERDLDAQIAAKKRAQEREKVFTEAETIRHYKDYNFAASPRRDADLENLIRQKERSNPALLLSREHRERNNNKRDTEPVRPPPERIGFGPVAGAGAYSGATNLTNNLYGNPGMSTAAALVGSAHAGESERDRRLRLRNEERQRRRMEAAGGGGGGGGGNTPSVYGGEPASHSMAMNNGAGYEPTPYGGENGGGGGAGMSRRDQIWEEKRRRHLENRQRMVEDTPAQTPDLSPRGLQRKSLKERETEREYERERARMMSAQARFDQHAGNGVGGSGGPSYPPTAHPAAAAEPSPRYQAPPPQQQQQDHAPLWAEPSANRPIVDDNDAALGGSIFGGLGEGERKRKQMQDERKAEMQAFMQQKQASPGGYPNSGPIGGVAANPRHGRRAHQEPTPKIGSPRLESSAGGLFAGLGDKSHDPGIVHANERRAAQERFVELQSHQHQQPHVPMHGRRAVAFEEPVAQRQEYNPTAIPADYRQRQQSAPASRPRQTAGRRASLDDTQVQAAAEKKSYAQELQEQMRMKEEAKRLEKQREREADRRQMDHASHYSPFGRGGGGAPLTDQSGNVITDLNPRHMEESQVQYNPLSGSQSGGIPPQPNFGDAAYGGMYDAPQQQLYGQQQPVQSQQFAQPPAPYQAPPQPYYGAPPVQQPMFQQQQPLYQQLAPPPVQQPVYQPQQQPVGSPVRASYGGNSGPPASSKAQYMRELQEQIEQKKRDKAAEKAKRDYEDRKLEAEIASYNPFGRGGAGAPVVDPKTGETVANLKMVDRDAVQRAGAAGQGGQGSMAPLNANSPYVAYEPVAPNVNIDNAAQAHRAASEQVSHVGIGGAPPPPGQGDHTRPSFASFDPNVADYQKKKMDQAAKQKAELEAQINEKERLKQEKARREREADLREAERLERERRELAAAYGAEEAEKARKETFAEEQKRQAEEARSAKAKHQAEMREKDRQADLKAKREQEQMARDHAIELAKERGEEPPPPLPPANQPSPMAAPTQPLSPPPFHPPPQQQSQQQQQQQQPPMTAPPARHDNAFSNVLDEAAQLPPAHMRSARSNPGADVVSATALKVEMMNDLRREFNQQHEQLRHQLEKQEEEVRTLRATASEARRDAEDANYALTKVQRELNAQKVENTKAEFDRIQQKLPPKYGRRSPRGGQDIDSAQQNVLRQQAADISDIRKSMASDSRLVYPDGHTSVLSSMSQVTSGGPTPEPVAGRRASSREGARRSAPRWQGRDRGRGAGGGVAYDANSLNIDSLYDQTQDKLKGLEQINDLDNDQVDALLSNFLNARKDRRPRPLTPDRMETSLRAETAFVPGV